MSDDTDRRVALAAVSVLEGETARNGLIHDAVTEAADHADETRAQILVDELPRLGQTQALEVLAAIGWLMLKEDGQ